VAPAPFNFVWAEAEYAAADAARRERATLSELIFIKDRRPLLVPKDWDRSKCPIVTIVQQPDQSAVVSTFRGSRLFSERRSRPSSRFRTEVPISGTIRKQIWAFTIRDESILRKYFSLGAGAFSSLRKSARRRLALDLHKREKTARDAD
jgi:hypothetical protein